MPKLYIATMSRVHVIVGFMHWDKDFKKNQILESTLLKTCVASNVEEGTSAAILTLDKGRDMTATLVR